MASTSLNEILKHGVAPLKSPQDNREYFAFRMDNGLNVVLCSDEEADKAAAAMSVEVGHFADPKDVPGLAHFCEHMLFLGTEKYPDESFYKKIVKENGGSTNAYTSAEHTCYFFDVNQQNLAEVLDIFSSFFICPQFTASATDRELNAVDSEHKKNLQTDSRRLYQLDKHLADPSHVWHKFATGHKETLQIPNIRERLIDFHKEYYSASVMCLSIIGKQSIPELREMCESMFSNIPSNGREIPKYSGNPYPHAVPQQYTVQTVKEMNLLKLRFLLPGSMQHFREKPVSVLGHLLGDESPGSILSYLKKQGWVNELSAGNAYSFPEWSSWCVSIELSEQGVNHIEDIVKVIFEYIKLVQQCDDERWQMYWNERKNLVNINFRFKGKENAYNYCTSLARGLQKIVQHSSDLERDLPLTIQCLHGLFYDIDLDLMKEYANYLRPDNVEIRLASDTKLDKNLEIQKEPWYGTEYVVKNLSSQFLQSLENCEPRKELHLPEENLLIPNDFTLFNEIENPIHPVVIPNNSCELWFKNDDVFEKPKVTLLVKILNPILNESPRMANIAFMYQLMVHDTLQENIYQSALAGMRTDVSCSGQAINFTFIGYNDKLSTLIDLVTQKVSGIEIKRERFDIQKERLRKYLANYWKSQPYEHVRDNFSAMVLGELEFLNEEHEEALKDLNYEDLARAIPQFYQNVKITSFAHGNVTRETANQYVDVLCKGLSVTTCELPFPLTSCNLRQENNSHVIYGTKTRNPDEVNSAVHTSWQIELDNSQDLKLWAICRLYSTLTSAPCFAYLRTQKQLGYIVWSSSDIMCGVFRFVIVVQSSSFSPNEINTEIDNFMKEWQGGLAEISEEELEERKKALALDITKKVKTLQKQTSQYWGEIKRNRLEFDRAEVLAEDVLKVTKDELLDFVHTYLNMDGPKRTRASFWQYGSKNEIVPYEGECQWIEDFQSWRKSLPRFQYPYPRETLQSKKNFCKL